MKKNTERKDRVKLIQTQLNTLTSSINADNLFEETKLLEEELLRLNEDFLEDQAAIFKNTTLLIDCKPTSEFLNMEKRKGGYCNLTELRVQKTDAATKLQVEEEIINPSKIRDEMKTFYQNHFNRQEVKEGAKAIN